MQVIAPDQKLIVKIEGVKLSGLTQQQVMMSLGGFQLKAFGFAIWEMENHNCRGIALTEYGVHVEVECMS